MFPTTHRALAWLAVAVYAAGTLTPCPPTGRIVASGDAHHTAAPSERNPHESHPAANPREHAHHHPDAAATASPSRDADPERIAALAAPCPCGCGDRADAGLAGKRLGPALPNSIEPPFAEAIALRSPATPATAPLAPFRLPDPVPLAT